MSIFKNNVCVNFVTLQCQGLGSGILFLKDQNTVLVGCYDEQIFIIGSIQTNNGLCIAAYKKSTGGYSHWIKMTRAIAQQNRTNAGIIVSR